VYRDAKGGGLWYPYMKSSKSYLCPADMKRPYFKDRHQQMSSYKMNSSVCRHDWDWPPVKLGQVWSPLCWLMWEPDDKGASGNLYKHWWDACSFPDVNGEGIGKVHSGGAVISAVGGNVSFMKFEKFAEESLNPQKNLCWWAPNTADGR
jgi:hypothetical protein